MRIKQIVSLLALCASLASCSTTYVVKRDILADVQPGMTQEEVRKTFGKPDYRRFGHGLEEWEYNKWISGSEGVIVVGFENGKVVSMDSFQKPQTAVPTPPVVVPPVPPVSGPGVNCPYPVGMPRMSEAEFQQYYHQVKAKPFSDDREEMIKTLSTSKRLTCRQCAQLMGFYSFSDDKMKVLRWFAPHLVDRENYGEILKQFSSSFDHDDVKKILGIK